MLLLNHKHSFSEYENFEEGVFWAVKQNHSRMFEVGALICLSVVAVGT